VACRDTACGGSKRSDGPRDSAGHGETHDHGSENRDETRGDQGVADGVDEGTARSSVHGSAHRVPRPVAHRVGEVARPHQAHSDRDRAQRDGSYDGISYQQASPKGPTQPHHVVLNR
jgi:hypothetical protein